LYRHLYLFIYLFFIQGELGIGEEDIQHITEKLKKNPFVDLQRDFASYYRIEKHVTSSPAFNYCAPIEIQLPADSEGKIPTFQYIPIISTVNAIISDPFFSPTVANSGDLIQDIKDGSAYKENSFFQKNPDAYTGILYSDALPLTNPLGAAKGLHKIVNVYFTLAEIPKHLRSKVENWFLVLMVAEVDLKGNREEVYRPLIEVWLIQNFVAIFLFPNLQYRYLHIKRTVVRR
jgi:hypothetical protein